MGHTVTSFRTMVHSYTHKITQIYWVLGCFSLIFEVDQICNYVVHLKKKRQLHPSENLISRHIHRVFMNPGINTSFSSILENGMAYLNSHGTHSCNIKFGVGGGGNYLYMTYYECTARIAPFFSSDRYMISQLFLRKSI